MIHLSMLFLTTLPISAYEWRPGIDSNSQNTISILFLFRDIILSGFSSQIKLDLSLFQVPDFLYKIEISCLTRIVYEKKKLYQGIFLGLVFVQLPSHIPVVVAVISKPKRFLQLFRKKIVIQKYQQFWDGETARIKNVLLTGFNELVWHTREVLYWKERNKFCICFKW